jgi:hypothetical protein
MDASLRSERSSADQREKCGGRSRGREISLPQEEGILGLGS